MRLLDTFRAPDYQPPKLPEVGMQLIELSRRTDADLNEVLRLLEKDPLLAAEVLRVARSPVYAGAAEVLSLHQALVRLGLQGMSDIVLQASLTMELFRVPVYQEVMEALNRHCTVTAHVARYICSASDIPDDHAFICGLMHDIGVAAALAVLAHRQRHPPPLGQVWGAIRQAHAEAGTIVAKAWNLPPEVTTVLSLHHDVLHDGKPHRVAAAVNLADALAIEAGFGYGAEVIDAELRVERAARFLRIDPERLKPLRARVQRLIETLET